MSSPFGSPTDQQVAAVLAGRGTPSPLAPYIPLLRQTAAKYQMPLAIVLTVLAQESGYGTDDNQLTRAYNYWGLTGTGSRGSIRICHADTAGNMHCWDFAAFASPQEGIEAAIRNMASAGYRGLTLRQFLSRYLTGSPSGSDDGVGNTVASYLQTALGIIAKLGGVATAGTVVIPAGPDPQTDPAAATGGGSVGGTGGGATPASSGGMAGQPVGDWRDALGSALGLTLPSPEEVRAALITGVMLTIGVALVVLGANGLAAQNTAVQAAKQTAQGAVSGTVKAGKAAAKLVALA